ncbi:hypothetical protein ACP4OV_001843 [Aristida adscensionis]
MALPQEWAQHLAATTVLMLLIVLVLPLLAVVLARITTAKNGRLHLPPGPARLPILGNLHQLMGGGGAPPHRRLGELARRHGPVMMLRLGAVPTVVVSSPAAAREVMRTHDAGCCSRPDSPGTRRMSYGHKDVAFAPHGD